MSDTALDAQAMAKVRALLAPPAPREGMWPVLGAAALAAASALIFATAMVLAPPVVTEHVVGAER